MKVKQRTNNPLKVIFLLLIVIFFITGCKKEISPVIRTAYSMGTFIEITAYDSDSKKAATAITKAMNEIQKLSDQLTIFNPASEISRVNREAFKKPVKVSPGFFAVLKEAQKFSRISEGAFDITIGPLMELWGFNQKKGRVPEEAEIKKTLESVGWEQVVLDGKKQTISFKKEGVKIDLGGIAKGYAADIAASILKKEGITSALVNAGGNIYALGAPPNKNFWSIGIRHPRKNQLIGKIKLKDRAVATSGDYENFFIKNGRRYAHIVNPQTGQPVKGILAITIVAPRAVDTDGLSTAVFVLGKEKGSALIEKLPETFALIICEGSDSSAKISYHLTKGAAQYFQITKALP